jgi:hypothetical protein
MHRGSTRSSEKSRRQELEYNCVAVDAEKNNSLNGFEREKERCLITEEPKRRKA